MATTVQSLVLQLAQRVDPRTDDGTELTLANIGTVSGSIFTAQRLLDIYNHARITLLQALILSHNKDDVVSLVGGTVKNEAITWTSQSATIPTDLIEFVSMKNAAKVPMILCPSSWMSDVESGGNTDLVSTASNLLIFESGANYIFLGTASLVPNANTYRIRYIGLTNWALSDVTTGTATETIDVNLHPVLLELAQGIALEMGAVELNALAARLLGGK